MKIPMIISVFALMGGVSYIAVSTVAKNTTPPVPAVTVEDLDALRAQMAAERSALSGQAEALANQLDEVESTSAALNDENGTLTARLAELESGKLAQAAALVSALEERDQLTADLEATAARLTALEADNAALASEKDALAQTVASAQAEIVALQASGSGSDAPLDALNAQIEAGQQEVQTLQAALTDLEGERDALSARIAELESGTAVASSDTNDEVTTLSNLVDQQTADLALAQDRIAELELLASTFESEVAGLTQTVTDRDAVIAELQAAPVSAVSSLQQCQEKTDKVLADGQIDFDNGTMAISAATLPRLEELAAIAAECVEMGLTLDIEGHTDSDGSEANNLALSNGRAGAVEGFFVEKGVPEAALRTIGFGEADPIADNATAEGRARNRRVVLNWE